VASENDSEPERARYLMGLSNELKGLHDEVLGQISMNSPASRK
jgi:hypothetical protein